MAGGAYAHSTWGLSASIATDVLDNGRRGAATAALSMASVASPAYAPPPTQQQQQSAPPQAFAAQLPSQQQEHQEPQPPQYQQQQQCSPPTAFAMGVGSADVHVKAPPQDALACDGICREQWEAFGWEGVMNRAHSSEVILQPPIQQQQQQQQAQAPPQHRVPVNINILMEDMLEVIIRV